jgi:tripartite-type tricarboxylate transporter receptor subunit TctC
MYHQIFLRGLNNFSISQKICATAKFSISIYINGTIMKKLLTILTILALLPALCFAWEPTKPVNVIVGNTPGAGNEVAFRKLSEIVQKTHPNFSYIVTNIPGSDSVIANNKFLDARPDGLTINIPSHMSSYVTTDIWQKNIKRYEWDSFIDVLTIGKSPLVLIAWPNSSVKTPQDFIQLIHTTQRQINIAVGGGAHRTAFEYLMEKGAGNRDLVKVITFNGPAPAVQSVASLEAGNTEFGIMPLAIAKPLLDSGKVKAIGITGTRKMPQYPDIVLLNTVVPGINVYAAWSIELPKNTSPEIVEWYRQAFSQAIRSEEYRQWAEQNVIFYEESELTTAGLHKHMVELRNTFLPVLEKIKVQ